MDVAAELPWTYRHPYNPYMLSEQDTNCFSSVIRPVARKNAIPRIHGYILKSRVNSSWSCKLIARTVITIYREVTKLDYFCSSLNNE
jgi:hypothetical protein